MSKTWDVRVIREDGFWVAIVVIPEPIGAPKNFAAATESRRVADLEDEVRDLIAGYTDADPDSFELSWDFSEAIGLQVSTALDGVRETRAELEHVRRTYESEVADSVAALRSQGVSLRDAGALLGVSFQRVQQIQAASRAAA